MMLKNAQEKFLPSLDSSNDLGREPSATSENCIDPLSSLNLQVFNTH